jgi:hypothetical protein
MPVNSSNEHLDLTNRYRVPMVKLRWFLYWFQCGAFVSQCGSGSREPNQCGSMRIRILVTKTYLQRYTYLQETMLFVYFWSISMFLDLDPHSQYGSWSRTAEWMRIRIYNTALQGTPESLTACDIGWGTPSWPCETQCPPAHGETPPPQEYLEGKNFKIHGKKIHGSNIFNGIL